MKAADWKRAVRPLLPADERWEFHQHLAYRVPFRWVLFGALAESSAFSKRSYIWRVGMPLFRPSDVLTLSLSGRIGGGATTYSVEEPQELAAAVREALAVPGEEETLAWMISKGARQRNRAFVEVAGYAQVIQGDVSGALETLGRVAYTEPDDRPWVGEMLDRMRRMCQALTDGGRDKGLGLLGEWRNYTVSCLGLRRE